MVWGFWGYLAPLVTSERGRGHRNRGGFEVDFWIVKQKCVVLADSLRRVFQVRHGSGGVVPVDEWGFVGCPVPCFGC